MKKNGYSIIELMLTLAIISTLTVLTLNSTSDIINQDKATKLAKQTLDYAKVANRYIKNHYQEILTQSATSSIIINWSQVMQEENQSIMTKTNLLGMTPCILVKQSGNMIQPYLYFVMPPTGSYTIPDPQLTKITMLRIGSQAGYLNQDGNIYGLYKGWQVSSSGFNSAICQGGGLITNSPVINLSFMQDLQVQLASDKTLHRPEDQSLPSGDPNNANTMTTDLYASVNNSTGTESPNRIVFNSTTNVGLQAANSYAIPDPNSKFRSPLADKKNLVVVRSGEDRAGVLTQGDFKAPTLQPLAQHAVGEACSKDMIGAMGIQALGAVTDVILRGQVQCTRNVLFCQGVDSSGETPCWLPTNSLTFMFHKTLSDYSIDCSKQVAPGFFIAPGTVQYRQGPSPDAFGNHANHCCHWAPDGANYSTGPVDAGIDGFLNTYSKGDPYNVSILIGEKIVQKWGAYRNDSFECQLSDCGDQYSYAPVQITTFNCTNDTSNFIYTSH
ncbi:MAG: type II secretion system GspH family protein [Proteobacteria bacterium]|nr:type II secretion system GspH family protein [Pseudomonadota bacterium]